MSTMSFECNEYEYEEYEDGEREHDVHAFDEYKYDEYAYEHDEREYNEYERDEHEYPHLPPAERAMFPSFPAERGGRAHVSWAGAKSHARGTRPGGERGCCAPQRFNAGLNDGIRCIEVRFSSGQSYYVNSALS